MLPINPKIAFGIWCAFLLCAYGQDATPSSGDRLEAETAIRLREFEKNHDRGGPRRPMSDELESVKPSQIDNLTAEDLAEMTFDDPILKWAYASVFLRSWRAFEQLEPPLELVLADMRRRGEAVSPMLLKLISENQENRIEDAVLLKIAHLDTVRIEPFLEYARRLLRERTKIMTAGSAGAAAYALARNGTQEDEALLEWVINERPFMKYTITKELKTLRDRLATPPSAPRPERRDIPSSNAGKSVRAANGTDDYPQQGSDATTWTKLWLIGGMILIVLLGVYRLLCKRPRGDLS